MRGKQKAGADAEHLHLGRWGEELTALILGSQGYRLVCQNWRPQTPGLGRLGEIDLVFEDPAGQLVFCEVKTRSALGYGHPFEAVHQKKARRLRQLALAWSQEQPGTYLGYRIDLVAICGQADSFSFEHLQAVV